MGIFIYFTQSHILSTEGELYFCAMSAMQGPKPAPYLPIPWISDLPLLTEDLKIGFGV